MDCARSANAFLPHVNRARAKGGFTVAELLVAGGITVILSGILLTMIVNVLKVWNRTSGTLSAHNQGALVLDYLTEDLQQALYRADGGVWLAATIIPDRDSIRDSANWRFPNHPKPEGDPGSLSLDEEMDFGEQRYGMGGTWLRLFTASTKDSLPTAVAYQIRRGTITGNPRSEQRYMFYRAEVRSNRGTSNSAGAFEAGFNLDPDLDANGYYHSDWIRFGGGSLMNNRSINNPYTVTSPPRNSVLANDVIDFGVRFYLRGPGGSLELVYPIDNDDLEYRAGADDEPFPHVADVFVRILTPRGAQLLQHYENAPRETVHDDAWWEIAEENSHLFSRRIQLVVKR